MILQLNADPRDKKDFDQADDAEATNVSNEQYDATEDDDVVNQEDEAVYENQDDDE